VGQIIAGDQGRIPALLPLRYKRMRPDPFSFLRGAAAIMAADLATLPTPDLRVQAGGDAHLMNFGAFWAAADAPGDGRPVFDVNDFDETLPAAFEWDLKRLATGLVVAARVGGTGDRAARTMARRVGHAYRRLMHELAAVAPLEAWRARVDLEAAIEDIGDRDVRRRERQRLHDAAEASRTAYGTLLAPDGTLRFKSRPPEIFRLGEGEAIAHGAFARYGESLPEERQVLLERYRLKDVVFKAVGVGSVGMFAAIGLFATADGDTLLLQLKEARPSVLAPHAGPSQYTNQGQRVVVGQRLIQTAPDVFLGWTASGTAGTPDERHFYVRQLKDARLATLGPRMGKDRRIEVDSLPFYARLCGHTLARAHARGGDAARIAGYLGDGTTFDEALAEFALSYADQTYEDHAAFVAAIKAGRIEAAPEDDP
jgi:uncharacterized protein (DUF2252 family)